MDSWPGAQARAVLLTKTGGGGLGGGGLQGQGMGCRFESLGFMVQVQGVGFERYQDQGEGLGLEAYVCGAGRPCRCADLEAPPTRLHRDQGFRVRPRKVDVRLPGKGNSNFQGVRPVHLINTMME